ncbi:uncharacterized protein PG998_007701 [Apiospora kogelbergensis]|uniref:Uncharacterized protein n=1 Tax=Apiospora kogelbergensis TaxID=1337665 RepID=A0AAW0QNY3_9PEZI
MNDLITTVVVTLVLVIVIGSLIFVTAMYWTQLLRRFAPNRFSEPMSEKTNQWPQPPYSHAHKGSGESHLISPVSSPTPSPRSSRFSDNSDSPITTPQASRQSPERSPERYVR